jgi:hypothetical protein
MSNPWDGVALVTISHPRQLSEGVLRRLRGQVERTIRPYTVAPVVVLEEGATVQLHGNPERRVGALEVPFSDVKHSQTSAGLTLEALPGLLDAIEKAAGEALAAGRDVQASIFQGLAEDLSGLAYEEGMERARAELSKDLEPLTRMLAAEMAKPPKGWVIGLDPGRESRLESVSYIDQVGDGATGAVQAERGAHQPLDGLGAFLPEPLGSLTAKRCCEREVPAGPDREVDDLHSPILLPKEAPCA